MDETRAVAIGAAAVGALATGAFAIGAVALFRLDGGKIVERWAGHRP